MTPVEKNRFLFYKVAEPIKYTHAQTHLPTALSQGDAGNYTLTLQVTLLHQSDCLSRRASPATKSPGVISLDNSAQ